MREEIIQAARRRIGIPWRHQGRTEAGLDCIGLIMSVATEVGIAYHDLPAYTRTTYQNTFLKEFRAQAKLRAVSERVVGDMLLLKDGLYPCHVAFYSMDRGQETIIHTSPRRKGTIEEPLAPYLDRVTHCFTFNETETEEYHGSIGRENSARDRRIRSRSLLRESGTRPDGGEPTR